MLVQRCLQKRIDIKLSYEVTAGQYCASEYASVVATVLYEAAAPCMTAVVHVAAALMTEII
jgi:hypothetical protein